MSVSAFYSASRIVPVLLDLTRLCDDAIRCRQLEEAGGDDGQKALLQASVVNRVALLGCSSLDMLMTFWGAKAERINLLKKVELLPRILQLPISTLAESESLTEEATPQAVCRFIEKGILYPMSDVCRFSLEANMAQEASYLEKSPEELAKERRAIIERDPISGDPKFIGYRPVTVEECRKNIVQYEAFLRKAVCAQTLLSAGAIENGVYPVYKKLAEYFSDAAPRHLIIALQLPDRLANQGDIQGQNNAWDIPDFVGLQRIPLPLHGDAIFSKYICPITQEPIRDPVCDPNGTTIYERSAICTWLRTRQESPITRQPLTVQQLLERPSLAALIDRRLRQHEEGLRDYLRQQLNAPVEPDVNAIEGQPRD